MGDSFDNLWSTAAPSNPLSLPQKPQKLNDLISSATTSSQPARPHNDLFTLLAASNSSSNSNSRTSSPGTANQTNHKSSSPKLASPSDSDAFSGLLSDSFGNGTLASGNLSMAERAARVEKERRDKLLSSTKQPPTKPQSPAWVGLDSLGTTTPSFTPPAKQTTQQRKDDFDWLFDSPVPTSSKPPPPPPSTRTPPAIPDDDEEWGLSGFTTKPTAAPVPLTPQQQTANPSSIWDFEDVDHSNRPPPPPRRANRPNSPGEDFDFGSREDRLLGHDSNDEDDFLGSLSKPLSSVPARRPPVSSCTPADISCLLTILSRSQLEDPPLRPVQIPLPHT